jgi:hypothetical protein
MKGALAASQKMMAGLGLAAVCICGWLEAAARPFGVESSAITFSVGAAIVMLSAILSHRRGPAKRLTTHSVSIAEATSFARWGILSWLLAGGLALTVELWELFHSPRARYPTLSSLANEVIGPGHRIARAVAFVCWALCGLIFASRSRRQA